MKFELNSQFARVQIAHGGSVTVARNRERGRDVDAVACDRRPFE
ncbi:hypothetical protein [Haloterrigena gelatinilytica]|nr:hypothetical protein [Haloterrigena gelatinilytica]